MIKSKMKFRVSFICMLIVALVGTGLIIEGSRSKAHADQQVSTLAPPFKATHSVTWADGSAGYGVSPSSYVEDGVTYFQDGSIIEVAVVLPDNHSTISTMNEIRYDSTKLTLVSSYTDVTATMPSSFYKDNFEMLCNGYPIDATTSMIRIQAASRTCTPNYEGGKLCKIYFKINQGVATEEGTTITFTSPYFDAIDANFDYLTLGFDPADKLSMFCECDPFSIVVKKPKANETSPSISLETATKTIYEGDVFDPSSLISSVKDSQGNTVGKENVTISGGDGVFTKHQPEAGTYTYTYSITDDYGKTTTATATVTVTERTYTITKVDKTGKEFTFDAGTSEDDMKKELQDAVNDAFKVTVSCNDGSTFMVEGVALNGNTEKYKVDSDGKLIGDQTFGVNYELVMPIISYDSDGNRVITKYNGSDVNEWNKLSATKENYIVKGLIKINGSNNSGNNGNNSGNGNDGSKDSVISAASTAGAGDGSTGVGTADTTNTIAWMFTALMSMVAMGFGVKKVKSSSK
ncbi:hypothetical protein M2475_001696 [Breznakia sp. PF5-3]|uniref:bacterial Ig-like domain-containing protein n=1 Tax=unclassified Breznakia TaxID=2623764 RepID=UPI0024077056|nr:MULTISPECIES: bacterial Ig-like domain-containing protein [unclassified Breznakia]MDF9825238.1 hypothetical protein [Breznakia sp. PM6-1]MDF9836120.1 hypothetical protein [Breznakia sp. PF5-3]MDF9838391.1 hypothetical protein [Breznakia sp. PFB2-8]MDF9860407.1 hypothetical protein [Breznakia sp. PH5-24]